MLPLSRRLSGAITRRLPVEVRRVRMWRDGIYHSIGGGGWDEDDALDATWPSTLQTIRGRVSGMRLALDLTDWMERRTYFTGRFYQEDIEELLSSILRPGDNFVDVGANIGLVTLHAASIVGRQGAVWSFEPNPAIYARLYRHITMNDLKQCRARNCGLGEEAGSLKLSLYGRHSGRATLVRHDGDARETVSVDIVRGEEALIELDTSKPAVIKIDVEGFEAAVVSGLGKILDGNVAVVIEVSRSWLDLAGSSAEHLHDLLAAHGLKPHSFGLRDSRYKRELVVERLADLSGADQFDCLFMRPNSTFAKRLR